MPAAASRWWRNEVKTLGGQTAKATEEIWARYRGCRRQRAFGRGDRNDSAHLREVGAVSATIATAVTEQDAATSEIARSAEIGRRSGAQRACSQIHEASGASGDATKVKAVSDDLGAVASRLRHQVDGFFQKLQAS